MTTVQSEVYEAFRTLGVEEEKALKAASALSKRDEDVVQIKSDLLLMKWMIGAVLTLQFAILAKAFFA